MGCLFLEFSFGTSLIRRMYSGFFFILLFAGLSLGRVLSERFVRSHQSGSHWGAGLSVRWELYIRGVSEK